MLLVKASVQPSKLEGLGLFAAEQILKGAPVWKFDSRFDLLFDPKDVEVMEPSQKELVLRYAYLSTESGKYVYCADDARFMNHSSKHNNLDVTKVKEEPETRAVANRYIQIGEELLINYRTFDQADTEGIDAYLND